ncbi:MAG: class I tRNA ligase family protein, partial [Parachlamydia sp.]|nr:class I tRNA ligase family protein [Parachlamydia sp.]
QKAPDQWIQDPDVLDTWFSAALWPFATLGWPDKTPELDKFYPNAVLVTGHDILFFWVARMLAMGNYAMGQPPFPQTFLHGLIYGKSYWRENPEGGIEYAPEDERLQYDLGKPVPKEVFSKWEKMSKSKGNIIDPLEMIDMYGTDAVRMALCASATQARQIDLDRRRFEEYKNFANKMWNGARFVLMNLEGNEQQNTLPLTAEAFSQGLDESLLTLEDRWILSKLGATVKNVNAHLANYHFDQAALEAYDFFWKEFCAYYLEVTKPALFGKLGTPQERLNKQKLLVIVLCQAIRLMHPMAPFITEELFHALKARLEGITLVEGIDPYTKECIIALQKTACLIAPYPKVVRESDCHPEIDAAFETLEQVVYTIRNIRGEMKLPPSMATDVYIIGQPLDPEWQAVKENTAIIPALVRINRIIVSTETPELAFASTGVYHGLKILLPLPPEMVEAEKTRLIKEEEKISQNIDKLKNQLSNQEFLMRAPPAVIEKLKMQISQNEQELSEIHQKIKNS